MLGRGAVPRNSLRATRCVQTDAASQITKRVCPAAHAPAPRPALLGTARRGLKPDTGHRCARPPTRRRCAPRAPGRAQRWPVSSPPPFRLRLGRGGGGVACAKSRMLRGLARCGCLSEARSAQRVPQRTPPASRPRCAPTRSVGVADCGARLFASFLVARQERRSPAGASPGPGKQTPKSAKTAPNPIPASAKSYQI